MDVVANEHTCRRTPTSTMRRLVSPHGALTSRLKRFRGTAFSRLILTQSMYRSFEWYADSKRFAIMHSTMLEI